MKSPETVGASSYALSPLVVVPVMVTVMVCSVVVTTGVAVMVKVAVKASVMMVSPSRALTVALELLSV